MPGLLRPTFLLAFMAATTGTAATADAGYEEAVAAFNRGDYEAARSELGPAAEAGEPQAQFMLGFMYGYGRGANRDPVRAADWYWKAASQGVTPAQITLARMYEQGEGLPRDLLQAYHWYGQALERLGPSRMRRDVAAGRDRVARDITDAQLAGLRAARGADLPQAPKLPESAPQPIESRVEPAARPKAKHGDRHLATLVQQGLADLGYDVGKVDGLAGEQTEVAVRAFQRDQGWPEDGRLSERLLTEMIMVRRAAESAANPRIGGAASAELRDYARGVVAALDARIRSLEAVAGQINTIEAVNHGFLLLDRWEDETRQVLLERVGTDTAGEFGKWEAGLVLGDTFGNFRRRTAANRIFLYSLREAVESRPEDYYALYSSSL